MNDQHLILQASYVETQTFDIKLAMTFLNQMSGGPYLKQYINIETEKCNIIILYSHFYHCQRLYSVCLCVLFVIDKMIFLLNTYSSYNVTFYLDILMSYDIRFRI